MSILTKEQVSRVRLLDAEQKLIDKTFGTSEGWMCEGADDNLIAFFNNKLDLFFYADYFGNIKGDYDFVNENLRKIVALEGKKCQIACYGKDVK